MWIHFGFGRIGKAAISQFLQESNQKYLIVDRNIDKKSNANITIKSNGSIKIIENISIGQFSDIDFSTVNVISTSVTTGAIKTLIPNIKIILENSNQNIYIIPFENDLNANQLFKSSLKKYKNRIIILESMIDMIVSNNIPGGVQAELEPIIKIDQRINDADIKKLENKWISENVKMEHIIKFYLVNGMHAVLAYFGLANGMKTINQVSNSEAWSHYSKNVIENFVEYMHMNYDLEKPYLIDYINKSLKRFSADIGDNVERVGRDPKRKLSIGERLDPVRDSKIWRFMIAGASKLK